MELNHKSWIFFFTIALFRITRAASYTELPGSCGSSDRTDSSERTESSRSGFVSTRAGNPLPQNGFNSSQKGITLVPMGYTGSSSSLGAPDHPLSTTLSTEEVKSAISSCKPKISCGSNLPQITSALSHNVTNLLLPQIVHLKPMKTSSLLTFRGVLGGVRLLLLPLDQHGLPRLGQPLQSSGACHSASASKAILLLCPFLGPGQHTKANFHQKYLKWFKGSKVPPKEVVKKK